MRIPKVSELMTPAPKSIGEDISIFKAKEYMKRGGFRHMPVLQAGRLVGVISDRDIKVGETFSGKGELTVGEVMTPDPYVVGEDEPVDEVFLTMAEQKYGCALVHHREGKGVIGIITDTDGLRFCGNLLRQFKEGRAA